MFSILPCNDKDKLAAYPEDTVLLTYTEDGTQRGFVAYRQNQSALEIVGFETGVPVSPDGEVSQEMFIHADALIRAVGSIALNKGLLTLCCRMEELAPVLLKFEFFRHGEYYTLYLNKLFAKGCSGCSGCNVCG